MSSTLMLCTGMYFEFERSCLLCAVPPRFAGSAHLSGFYTAWLLACGFMMDMCHESFDINSTASVALH